MVKIFIPLSADEKNFSSAQSLIKGGIFMHKDNEEIIDVEFCEVFIKENPKKILMVVTSAAEFKNGHKTGVWFEEFAIPYLEFLKQNYIITVASPNGGCAPIDTKSENLFEDIKWEKAKIALNDTVPINTVDFTAYDALVLPGGHGPIIDLYKNEDLGKIINDFNKRHKLIAAICHGPAGLLSAKKDGVPFVNGRKMTAFTNEEEIIAKMDGIIPFFQEDAFKEAGAEFIEANPGIVNIVEDDNLITAQNYQSSKEFAKTIVKHLDRA